MAPGRTQVMFNGVQVGLVKSIDMVKDYSSATADLRWIRGSRTCCWKAPNSGPSSQASPWPASPASRPW
ncbi:hypothetical protein [Enterobacter ludwigii]|uniref:hypothetical protein n=1 Tax=Enterobacter ludwigii TaxID=299767 RepID=UPI003BF98D4F